MDSIPFFDAVVEFLLHTSTSFSHPGGGRWLCVCVCVCVCVCRDCVCIVLEITPGPLLMVGAQYLFWNGRRKEGSLIQEKRKREGAFFKLLQRQVVTMWKVKLKQSSYYYNSWPFMDSLLLNHQKEFLYGIPFKRSVSLLLFYL